jgi:hypothetical protein
LYLTVGVFRLIVVIMMTATAFAIPKSGVSWRRASGEALRLTVSMGNGDVAGIGVA